MRNLFHVFCAVAFSLAAMQSVQAASERAEPTVPTSQTSGSGDTPQAAGVSCISAAYQHYLQLGAQPQNAWGDAVRDCQNGVDPSCIQFAQQHYLELGESAANAWSNAVRDCRIVTPQYSQAIAPRRY